MTPLLPDQVPDGWNKTSRDYDKNIWPLLHPFVEEIIRRVEPSTDQKVLDVAAGSGAVTLALAPKVGEVLAIDFAEAMLDRLRERAKEAGVTNVEARTMDGQDLRIEDESFDRVCSNFGVIFFPDRPKGFSEMRRVLRPGGRAVVTGWSGPEKFEAFGLFMGAVRRALPDRPKPASPPAVFSLADPGQFRDEMKSGGFSNVEMDTVSHEFEMESGEAFWELFRTSAPPAVALLESVGPEGSAKVRDAVLKKVQDRFGNGPVVLTNEAHVAVATR